jgi:chromosome segregation ATPase
VSNGQEEKAEDVEEQKLHAQALTLRTELRRADARMKVALTGANAASAALRENEDEHARWMKKTEAEIAKIRRENNRLERSAQQASSQEHRLRDVLRDAPEQMQNVLIHLTDECRRLEEENHQLESDLAAMKAEFGSVRNVVTRKSHSVGTKSRPNKKSPPRQAPSPAGLGGYGNTRQAVRRDSSFVFTNECSSTLSSWAESSRHYSTQIWR